VFCRPHTLDTVLNRPFLQPPALARVGKSFARRMSFWDELELRILLAVVIGDSPLNTSDDDGNGVGECQTLLATMVVVGVANPEYFLDDYGS